MDTLCHFRDLTEVIMGLVTERPTPRNFAVPRGLMKLNGFSDRIWIRGWPRQQNCKQRLWQLMSLIGQEVEGRSEVRTTMRERFTVTELTALRNDLLQSGMIDSREAAELLQVFLMGRGYGVSPQAAMDAAGRVEMAGCSLPVLQQELENLALVM